MRLDLNTARNGDIILCLNLQTDEWNSGFFVQVVPDEDGTIWVAWDVSGYCAARVSFEHVESELATGHWIAMRSMYQERQRP